MKFYQRLSFILFHFGAELLLYIAISGAGRGRRQTGGHRSPREKCGLQVILILAMMLLMSMPIAYDEHDACKSSSWGAQRININIFDPCVWRVLADCCYPEKMRRGWTLAWAPTQLLQVEIKARPVSIVGSQLSETSYCSSSGSSTTNLTSNFPNPANIDIIINTCEVKRSLYLFLWVFDNLSAINVMILNTFRLEICKKNYTTVGFFGPKILHTKSA